MTANSKAKQISRLIVSRKYSPRLKHRLFCYFLRDFSEVLIDYDSKRLMNTIQLIDVEWRNYSYDNSTFVDTFNYSYIERRAYNTLITRLGETPEKVNKSLHILKDNIDSWDESFQLTPIVKFGIFLDDTYNKKKSDIFDGIVISLDRYRTVDFDIQPEIRKFLRAAVFDHVSAMTKEKKWELGKIFKGLRVESPPRLTRPTYLSPVPALPGNYMPRLKTYLYRQFLIECSEILKEYEPRRLMNTLQIVDVEWRNYIYNGSTFTQIFNSLTERRGYNNLVTSLGETPEKVIATLHTLKNNLETWDVQFQLTPIMKFFTFLECTNKTDKSVFEKILASLKKYRTSDIDIQPEIQAFERAAVFEPVCPIEVKKKKELGKIFESIKLKPPPGPSPVPISLSLKPALPGNYRPRLINHLYKQFLIDFSEILMTYDASLLMNTLQILDVETRNYLYKDCTFDEIFNSFAERRNYNEFTLGFGETPEKVKRALLFLKNNLNDWTADNQDTSIVKFVTFLDDTYNKTHKSIFQDIVASLKRYNTEYFDIQTDIRKFKRAAIFDHVSALTKEKKKELGKIFSVAMKVESDLTVVSKEEVLTAHCSCQDVEREIKDILYCRCPYVDLV